MLKRQPKATKPARYFAEKFGVSSKHIKRLADRHGWKKITYSDSPTATVYLFEQQVNDFFMERQNA
jgi:uncharacterized protein YjcR